MARWNLELAEKRLFFFFLFSNPGIQGEKKKTKEKE